MPRYSKNKRAGAREYSRMRGKTKALNTVVMRGGIRL